MSIKQLKETNNRILRAIGRIDSFYESKISNGNIILKNDLITIRQLGQELLEEIHI